ncbi:hypothetical protein BC936DRAFT_139489 [Jimgerdemannia flammicorona]|uniref:DUF7893 domain-containing protein n=1 Tax=Jimgerdemannia flammicorona TaxID=994334 RepID=A0A433DHP0_9FUNG|nr:hypothetical protein BC936DRAFT_139489 [Jimgerdemannia flammicorona]
MASANIVSKNSRDMAEKQGVMCIALTILNEKAKRIAGSIIIETNYLTILNGSTVRRRAQLTRGAQPRLRLVFDAVEIPIRRRSRFVSETVAFPSRDDVDLQCNSAKRLKRSCPWRDNSIFVGGCDERAAIRNLERQSQIKPTKRTTSVRSKSIAEPIDLEDDQQGLGPGEQCGNSESADDAPANYIEYSLDDFVVYNNCNQPIEIMEKISKLNFDGIISFPAHQASIPVLAVAVDQFSVGGLELTDHVAYAWIKSSKRNGVWYRLGRPLADYKDLFDRFTWKINFMKHLLNFLELYPEATVNDLCRGGAFKQFLIAYHGVSPALADWVPDLDLHDFRPNVVKHAKFVCWQICWQIPQRGKQDIAEHPFWSDACFKEAQLCAFGMKKTKTNLSPHEYTVVTPTAYKYFQPMFGNILKRYDHGVSIRNNFLGVHIDNTKKFKNSVPAHQLRELDQLQIEFRNSCEIGEPKRHATLCEHFEEVVVDGVIIRIGDCVQMPPSEDEDHKWAGAGGVWIGRVLEIFKKYRSMRDKGQGVAPEACFRLLWMYDINQTIMRWVRKVDEVGHKRECGDEALIVSRSVFRRNGNNGF